MCWSAKKIVTQLVSWSGGVMLSCKRYVSYNPVNSSINLLLTMPHFA